MITINVHVDKEHEKSVSVINHTSASNSLPAPQEFLDRTASIKTLPKPPNDLLELPSKNLPSPLQLPFGSADAIGINEKKLPRPEPDLTGSRAVGDVANLPTPPDHEAGFEDDLPRPISMNKSKKRSKK